MNFCPDRSDLVDRTTFTHLGGEIEGLFLYSHPHETVTLKQFGMRDDLGVPLPPGFPLRTRGDLRGERGMLLECFAKRMNGKK